MEKNEKLKSSLHQIIEINKEAVEGYKSASKGIENRELKPLFLEFSTQRQKFLNEAKAKAKNAGFDIDESTSWEGELHQALISMKAALTSGEEVGMIDECITGEQASVKVYTQIIESGNLSQQTANTFRNHLEIINNFLGDLQGLRKYYKLENERPNNMKPGSL